MQVQIRFLDGEIMDGQSDAATLQRMGFPVSFVGGNNQIAWVSLASIKYVLFKGGHFEEGSDEDPRDHQNLVKVVMHFIDGETLRSYKDDTFSQDGEGFNMRIFDKESKSLLRVLVSLHALKAIFFVNQWDSRTEAERTQFAGAAGEQGSRHSALQEQAAQQVQNLTPTAEG